MFHRPIIPLKQKKICNWGGRTQTKEKNLNLLNRIGEKNESPRQDMIVRVTVDEKLEN